MEQSIYIGIYSCRLYGLLRPSYRPQLVVLACCGCLACLLSVSWYLLSTLVGCLACLLSVTCLEWPPRPPWVPSGGQAPDHQEGGRFFKEGGEANRNPTRPHFYARGQKKCGFSAQKRGKRGEFEEKEKRVRKRESKEKEKGCCGVILGS